jgi:hypothetical protein
MPDSHILLLIVSWLVYFGLHSLLASIGVKQYVATRWPRAMPAYRLVFNVLAVVLLAVPLWLSLTGSGPWLWRWSGVASYVSLTLYFIVGSRLEEQKLIRYHGEIYRRERVPGLVPLPWKFLRDADLEELTGGHK